MPTTLKKNRDWMEGRRERYPYWATLSTRVTPEHVERTMGVNIVSAPLKVGVRTYAFATEMARDLFVRVFELDGAEKV